MTEPITLYDRNGIWGYLTTCKVFALQVFLWDEMI